MIHPVELVDIDMESSIQCRARIDGALVDEYAERMRAGDRFPPVELFGCLDLHPRYWIGDGWHRIMAAKEIGSTTIAAIICEGMRLDALRHALKANAMHGQRRTNADKRRCVEIALREFPEMSARAIGELCGVNHELVTAVRPKVADSATSSVVTGSDGKQYPTKRKAQSDGNGTSGDDHAQPLKRGTSKKDMAAAIASLLASGHNIEQIAAIIGRKPEVVRLRINEFGLIKLEKRGRGNARISPRDVIEETVNAIAATTQGLRMIKGSAIEIKKTEAAALLTEMTEAMRALRWLVDILKGLSNA